jgi:putative DNA primase/helicase
MKERLDSAEPTSPFGIPDMDVLRGGRRQAVPMPADLFGDAWQLVSDVAEGTGAPVDYAAVGFISACASLIGGKRRVRPYAETPWSEPCIIWAGAVGDPSSKKSPVLDAITGPMRVIEADHAFDHQTRMLAYFADCERAKVEKQTWQKNVEAAHKDGMGTPSMPLAAVEPEEPQRRRTMIMDATPEAVGAILAGNPAGTMHFRDELAGWLTSFERYSPGGREFWLEAYGGRPFVIDRKGAKAALRISFNGVSVLGGIQPAKMADALLGAVDDGLVARFLWAWPDPVPFRRPRQLADIGQLETIYRRLDGLQWGRDEAGNQTSITIPLAPEASDLFYEWGRSNSEGIEDAGALYKSFCGKLDGAVLRLALVSELTAWAIRGGPEPETVSARSVGAAAEWVDEYAKPMALRVYGDASLPLVERNAAVLARYILKLRMDRVNKRDLKRSPHKSHLPTMRMAQPLDDAVAYLCDAGWLVEIGGRGGDVTGRSRGDYLVNPAVFGGN